MGNGVNGHETIQVAQTTRELMLASIMSGLSHLMRIEIDEAEHPTKPGVVRLSVKIGQVVATRDPSRFQLANSPAGEFQTKAAHFAVALKEALETHLHSEAATFLAPWLGHKSDCAVRSCDVDIEEAVRMARKYGGRFDEQDVGVVCKLARAVLAMHEENERLRSDPAEAIALIERGTAEAIERGEEFGPCSCGLDQVISKAQPSAVIEVTGDVDG